MIFHDRWSDELLRVDHNGWEEEDETERNCEPLYIIYSQQGLTV